MSSVRSSCDDDDETQRCIPSFIEARPPLVLNPFMRPKPQKGKKLFCDLLEDSDSEDPDLVQVYLRLKPCNTPSNLYEVHSERSLITSLDTTTAGHGRRTQHNVSKEYTFSHIFGPESSQEEIFERVVKDNLKKLPDGNSFTLLTYGASGSGKTFTLMGTVSKPGLVPRSLEYVFKVVDAAQYPLYKPDERGSVKLGNAVQDFELKFVKRLRQISAPVRDKYRRMSVVLGANLTSSTIDLANRRSHYVWVSFIEIYNEGIYDLLAPGERRHATKLAIREDASGNVYVKGATQAFVRSGEEAYDVLVAGKLNLQVAATGIHAQSSRSHCIFTITMLTETEGGTRSACVRLCDLAGCERAARTRNTGARMQESRAINSSLHVLERCLRMLRRKRPVAAVVPYRESKLTRLLGAGLSGTRGEAVSMVVTINPSPEYVNESRHVLQLAAVAKDIQINETQLTEYPSTFESSVDTTMGYNSFEVMKLRADNERLLFELKQAEARNKELVALMEEERVNNEKTIWELLEETKAMYEEYYEAQMKALQTKMDDLVEEYECRLKELSQASQPIHGDTSSKKYQNQEKSAEQLDRAGICSDERDENADGVISLTDSEGSDSEDDAYNESLEPTFRKEDINRSKLIRQSIIADINSFNRTSRINESSSDESELEKSTDTIKEDDNTCESNVDTYLTNEELNCTNDMYESDIDNEEVISTVKKATNSSRCTYVVNNINEDIATTINEQKEISKPQRPLSRETYSVATSEVLNISKDKNLQDEIPKSVKDNSYKDLTSMYIKLPEINETIKPLKGDTFTDLNNSKSIKSQEKNVFSKSKDNKFSDPNFSEIIKLQEQNENLNLQKDDTFNKFNISKGIKSPEQNQNSNSLKGDNFKHLNISEGVQLPGQNEISNSLKEDSFKNISKNIELHEQNEVPKSLKHNFAKENDIFSVDKIPNNHNIKDTVKLKTPTDNINVTTKILPNTYAKKIINSIKQSTESNNSLLQFERLEMETIGIDDENKRNTEKFFNINHAQEKRKFFDEDCLDKTPATVVKAKDKKPFFDNSNLEKNNIQDNLSENSKTSIALPEEKKKFLEETVTKQVDRICSVKKLMISSKVHDSIDLFEELDSPQVNKDVIIETQVRIADNVRNSIDTMSISDKKTYDSADAIEKKLNRYEIAIKTSKNETFASVTDSNLEIITTDHKEKEKSKMDVVFDNESNMNKNPIASFNNEESQLQENCTQVNNTTEEFENIYKNISESRATEFDFLVSQDSQENNEENYTNTEKSVTDHIKYNLRQKPILESRSFYTERKRGKNKVLEGEILLESLSKDESKSRPNRRHLRLRRQKTENEDVEKEKLKDMVNLQAEFSDVTLDVPAPVKASKDIPSPEKIENEENNPPLEVQSCPAKSITRSRRKLFTPRAEPLEESPGGTGDSTDQVRIPRPSYHRPRARRKL